MANCNYNDDDNNNNNLFNNIYIYIIIHTLTFEKYFTTSKKYVMADDEPDTWLCKLHANCISKSKTAGNQNTANEKVYFEDSIG